MKLLSHLCLLILWAGFCTSCTLLKLSEYQECEESSDCLQGFEICNESRLCQTQGALCRWSVEYDQPFTSVHSPEGAVIGVLTDDSKLMAGGSQRSAYLGLHTGSQVASTALLQPPASLLICNPDVEVRDQVLEVFKAHDVKVIIGEPRLTDLDNGEVRDTVDLREAYISIGLEPMQVNSSLFGWVNLNPNPQQLERAFESVSNEILDYLVAKDDPMNIIVPVRSQPLQPDFIQDIIWRLSPYEMSIFKTLVVYYSPTISIDETIIKFLGEGRPLRALVSYEALDQPQMNSVTDAAVKYDTSSSTQAPLWIYSAFWETTYPLASTRNYWSDVIQLGLLYGPAFTETMESAVSARESEAFEEVKTSATEIAISLGAGDPRGMPWFNLAYDASVIASIATVTMQNGESPRSTLNDLTNASGQTEELLDFSRDGLSSLLGLGDGGEIISAQGKRLFGLTGVIKHRQETDELPVHIICSKDGLPPLLAPVVELEPAEYRELSNGITQRFELTPDYLTQCESL